MAHMPQGQIALMRHGDMNDDRTLPSKLKPSHGSLEKMNQSQLVSRIIAAFKELEKEVKKVNEKERSAWGDTEWTNRVLTKLCRLGKSLHFSTWASGVSSEYAKGGEWLYDVTWLDSNDGIFLSSTPMVAECEWSNPGEIDSDFQKLLVARATVRVMVYDAEYYDGKMKASASKFCDWVGAFEGARGDTYLLIGFVRDEGSWHFECATIVAQERGQLPILQLLQ